MSACASARRTILRRLAQIESKTASGHASRASDHATRGGARRGSAEVPRATAREGATAIATHPVDIFAKVSFRAQVASRCDAPSETRHGCHPRHHVAHETSFGLQLLGSIPRRVGASPSSVR